MRVQFVRQLGCTAAAPNSVRDAGTVPTRLLLAAENLGAAKAVQNMGKCGRWCI